MKKDVIASCPFILTEVTGIKGDAGFTGIQLTMVFSIDIAGSVPDFMKKKIAEEQAKEADTIINFINKNYKK